MEQDLLRYLDFTDVDYNQLQSLCTSLLMHKLHLSEAGCPVDLHQLAQRAVIIKMPRKILFYQSNFFERLFITLRQSILLGSSAQLAISSRYCL